MEFRNDFVVDGAPAEVIAVFADTPLVASFLPGASVGERREDGSYPGQLAVSFGPKRLLFKGSLTNTVRAAELAGDLEGQASADVRGAKMAVSLHYRLLPEAEGARTRVETVSEAELAGILAEFARTGGAALTQALLEQFAQRFSAHMQALQAARPIAPAPAAENRALSGWSLMWQMLRAMFQRRRDRPARDA